MYWNLPDLICKIETSFYDNTFEITRGLSFEIDNEKILIKIPYFTTLFILFIQILNNIDFR